MVARKQYCVISGNGDKQEMNEPVVWGIEQKG